MLNLLISYATVISYVAFSTDLIFQILKIYRRKSSADISAQGTAFRLIGSTIILLKFITVKDPYLIVGQIVFTLTVATYLIMIAKYRKHD